MGQVAKPGCALWQPLFRSEAGPFDVAVLPSTHVGATRKVAKVCGFGRLSGTKRILNPLHSPQKSACLEGVGHEECPSKITFFKYTF